MTRLWKLDAVHECFDGLFCRLFAAQSVAEEAQQELTLGGWWVDLAPVEWPLEWEVVARVIQKNWPICDPDELLDLVLAPPKLELAAAAECYFATIGAKQKAAKDLKRIKEATHG